MKDDEWERMVVATAEIDRGKAAALRQKLLQRKAHISVLEFRRPPSAWERLRFVESEPISERGATVVDELGGGVYDVVLDDRGRVTYFAARALDGALPTVAELSRQQVAQLAARFLAQLDGDDGDPVLTIRRDDALRAEASQPRAEWISQVIRDAHAAGVSPRAALAAQTGKPMPTIDRWLREARAADPTLPQATRRPRNPKGTER